MQQNVRARINLCGTRVSPERLSTLRASHPDWVIEDQHAPEWTLDADIVGLRQ